ncbi:PREDICTED: synaptopodin [Charadrius vociferus]|uniref:synaptopodin n=1 Tax=Charadrius vociferus TaxID=50402 RepID=UPI00052131A9|nr:PREDICTED: synaptopodin [Charadrius vociferus]
MADLSQEWKVVKIQRVLINPAGEPRKAGLSRSASLSEKELKEPEPSQASTAGEKLRANASPCLESPAEAQQVPLSIYLKENMASATTNGVQEQVAGGMESGPGELGDAGTPAGPSTVALAVPQSPEEGKNGEVPSEVPSAPKMLSGPPLGCGVSGPNPLPKTGILEESAARRASKKSMFTFVEKPKLGPNPDLLDLVQSADSRKKQKEQGEPGAEDEPFALGAGAANFVPNSTARGGQHLPPADDAPAWSSCLKSPTIQPKPKPQPSHNLSEARGKGAELFARRQSRMEKFIIEAPSQPELLRSPSPTMSLPPSWKYDANACLSPRVSRHPSRSPSRPSKTPPASLYGGNLVENEVSQKELEISKHQPYQLQSSLFILSPSKGPARSMPQETPPPRPSLPDAYPYPQQTSCPTSPLPPSPVWHPTVPSTGQTTSSPFPGSVLVFFRASEESRIPGGMAEPHGAGDAVGSLSLPTLGAGAGDGSAAWHGRERGMHPLEDGRRGPGQRRDAQPEARGPAGPTPVPRPLSPCAGAAVGRWPPGAAQGGLCGITPGGGFRKLQERRPPLPASPTWTPRLVRHPGSLDGWASPASVPELDEGPPMSPPWSERSLSPLRQDADPPRSPLPSPVVGGRSPAKRCTSRSPTDSDVSLDSEDSGAKSPGIHSFNLCPRGWTGSLRLKPGGLPSGAPCPS